MERQILIFLCSSIGGFSGAYFMLSTGFDFSFRSILITLTSLLISYYAGILIHEAGHLAAGKLAGMKFSSILAGPLMIINQNGKWRMIFLKHGLKIGGKATMFLDRSETRLKVSKQFIIMF
jgi:hypothetical protein